MDTIEVPLEFSDYIGFGNINIVDNMYIGNFYNTPIIGDALNINEIDYKIIDVHAIDIQSNKYELTFAVTINNFDNNNYIIHKRLPSEVKNYLDNKSGLIYVSVCYGFTNTNNYLLPTPGWWRIRKTHHDRYFRELLIPRFNYTYCFSF